MHQVSQILTEIIGYDDVTQRHVDEIKKELRSPEVRKYLENAAHDFPYWGARTVEITVVVSGPGRLQPVKCAIARAIRRVDSALKTEAA